MYFLNLNYMHEGILYYYAAFQIKYNVNRDVIYKILVLNNFSFLRSIFLMDFFKLRYTQESIPYFYVSFIISSF